MFFPRLRHRAKWVFAFLAVVFGLGFVVFGVGTGVSGTSIGDILNDVFSSGGSDQPSVDAAEKKLQENPDDAAAQLELANALQSEGRIDDAINALVRYTSLAPKDVDARAQLAALYDRQANEARDRVGALQAAAVSQAPGQLFDPPADSPLGAALSQDAIEQAVSGSANERITAAVADAQAAYRKSQNVYEQLTKLEPTEPSHFLRLGQASELAGDTTAAIAAYEQFLELSPDDASAPLVEQQLKLLKGETEPATTSSG